MLASFRKSFALLVALTAILFAGNAQALINSTATDGTYSNKVVHTFVSGGSCPYVSYNHYELYYRKLPTDTTWTLYFSRYVPGGYYYLWAEDTGERLERRMITTWKSPVLPFIYGATEPRTEVGPTIHRRR